MSDASKSVREFLSETTLPIKYVGPHSVYPFLDAEDRGVARSEMVDVLNALPALLAEMDEAKANVSALELDLKNSFARNVAHIEIALKKDIALTTLTRQLAEEKERADHLQICLTQDNDKLDALTSQRDGLVKALEFIWKECENYDGKRMRDAAWKALNEYAAAKETP